MNDSKLIFFDKTKQLPSLNQLRTMVLCEAIDRYLCWRNHINEPDKRGFNLTFFTWMRHYTAFGENRAKLLKQTLLSSPDDWLNSLKKHFSDYFSINNHSLDTYLLEAIKQTNTLFSTEPVLPELRNTETRKHLLDTILATSAISSSETPELFLPCIVTYLFSELRVSHKEALLDYLSICHLYEMHENKDEELCFDAFSLLAKDGFKEALPALERMARLGSMDQQKRLSSIYKENFHNETRSAYWEKRAENILELGPM